MLSVSVHVHLSIDLKETGEVLRNINQSLEKKNVLRLHSRDVRVTDLVLYYVLKLYT